MSPAPSQLSAVSAGQQDPEDPAPQDPGGPFPPVPGSTHAQMPSWVLWEQTAPQSYLLDPWSYPQTCHHLAA